MLIPTPTQSNQAPSEGALAYFCDCQAVQMEPRYVCLRGPPHTAQILPHSLQKEPTLLTPWFQDLGDNTFLLYKTNQVVVLLQEPESTSIVGN